MSIDKRGAVLGGEKNVTLFICLTALSKSAFSVTILLYFGQKTHYLLDCLGGIGEAVAAAVVGEPGITVKSLAVTGVPRSGKPAELLKLFGIDKDAIVEAVKKVVS